MIGLKINSRLFRTVAKKKADEAVFNKNEISIIMKEARMDFESSGVTAPLAIELNFHLGLRVGELVALKETDINGEYITISKQQVRRDYYDNNLKKISTSYEIATHTKTNNDRIVHLTPNAQEILNLAISYNKEHGYYDNGYIFLNPQGERVSSEGIYCRLKKYCKHNNIKSRGTHAIRRTVLSLLLENKSVSIDDVMRFAGHSQMSTTLNHYFFSMQSETEKDKLFSKILDEISK